VDGVCCGLLVRRRRECKTCHTRFSTYELRVDITPSTTADRLNEEKKLRMKLLTEFQRDLRVAVAWLGRTK